jgi:hypothetical protein
MTDQNVHVDPIYGCWLWQGPLDRDGYGRGRRGQAHVEAWLQQVGPVPEGKELDHLCRRRRCVRPAHLEPVTRGENERRKVWRRRAAQKKCPRGHAYHQHGRITREGGRVCLACAPPTPPAPTRYPGYDNYASADPWSK